MSRPSESRLICTASRSTCSKMIPASRTSDLKGRLIRVWTVGAVSLFERAGSYGFGWIRNSWRHYFALQNTTRESEQIRHENEALKLQITQLQGKAAEADRLAALLNFRQAHGDVPMIGARVIGTGAGTASLTIQLDRRERDGIRKNMRR